MEKTRGYFMRKIFDYYERNKLHLLIVILALTSIIYMVHYNKVKYENEILKKEIKKLKTNEQFRFSI